MKKIILILTICAYISSSEAQNFLSAKRIGGTTIDNGNSIKLDALGNIYTTGYFAGTIDFDPGLGVFNLSSNGSIDIFISKLDASGNFIWAKSMGGIYNDMGYSIAIDQSGNIYTTGYFQVTADFDPGLGVFNLTAQGGEDIFVSKLDASGNFHWAISMGDYTGGGGYLSNSGKSITVDAIGNVYLTGHYLGDPDFNPGAGIFNLGEAQYGNLFVLKLDSNGYFKGANAPQYTNSILQYYSSHGHSIALDVSGNIYLTGYFIDTLNFGGTILISSGNSIFVSKLGNSTSFLWTKQLGRGEGNSILTDTSGNVYTTGRFYGTSDFDPGLGVFNLSSTGGYDIFISKLDASGNFLWAKSMGGTLDEVGNSITIDPSGNVFITGSFTGTADFDPGAGIFNLTSVGSNDIYISKLNSSGNFLWAKQIGGSLDDVGSSIARDVSGNLYSTGLFTGTTDFDPGNGTFNLTSAGSSDIYISKLGNCNSTLSININPSAASFCIGGCTTLTATGATSYTWLPAAGLSGTTGASVTACPTVTTTYVAYGTNGSNCGSNSSVVTVNVFPAITPSGPTSICSGSNIVLSVSPIATSYQWRKNGIDIPGATSPTYAASATGNYTAFVINSCAAYTTAPFSLTVNSLPNSVISSSGPTTFCQGDSLVINAVIVSNRSYQWKLNGTNIPAATSSKYSAKATGTYTVTVTNTNTGCSSTSSAGIVVTVNPTPSSAFTSNGPTTFCSGGILTLTASTVGPSFQWIKNNIDIIGATGQTYNATATGTYKARASYVTGCSSTSSGLAVTVNPKPSTTVTASGPLNFCAGDSVIFTAATGTGFTYQWKRNGIFLAGAINKKYTAKNAGTYKVVVTKSTTGCSATSSNKIVTVPCKLDETEKEGINSIAIYPNPSTGKFILESREIINSGVVVVYDVFGKEVYKVNINNATQTEINLENISAGVYFVRVFDNDKNYCRKIIVQGE